MKFIFLYNNTFISLLNLINTLIKRNIKPLNIKDTSYSPNLFEKIIRLDISENEKILKYTIDNTNKYVFKILYYVFLSNDENKELIIYYFYLNALKHKEKVLNMRNLKCVQSALKISNYVSRENHKYKGFVRFKELENKILYAEIEPINNILEILSKHFKNRLKTDYWIIKDVKRNILSIYDKHDFLLINGENFKLYTNNYSKDEILMKDLWIEFYNTIGIESRKNDKCRMNFMPKRYWKYITEMEKIYEESN